MDMSALLNTFNDMYDKKQKEQAAQQSTIQSHWKNSYFPGIAIEKPEDYIAVIRNSMMRSAVAFDKKLDEKFLPQCVQFDKSEKLCTELINTLCTMGYRSQFKQLYDFSFPRKRILVLSSPQAVIFVICDDTNLASCYFFTLDGTIDILEKDIDAIFRSVHTSK